MTYPIPSYRYKCYTLNLMVVIQVLYLKAYGCTQYREAPQVPTKFLYSHDNLCYTPWSHVVQLLSSKSIIVNSLLLLQKNSCLLLHDCYHHHDYHCFQLLQLLLSYLFYYFASWIATYFIFNFVYKYYIIFRIIKKPTFYHRTTLLLPFVSLLYYYSKSL